MAVVIVCTALLMAGLTALWRWGALTTHVPGPWADAGSPPVSHVLRRCIWTAGLLVWTALITGVLVVGPSARLAMRVLAVTAGPAAQGQKTEADEIVGRISSSGTIGIFLFVGLFAGVVSALVFVFLRRWLPAGRSGGLVLGLILLVGLGTRIEPLRANNPDFDLVGPGWLAITIYAVMAVVQGMAVVAVAGRVSRWLPLPATGLRSLLPYAVLVVLVPTGIGAVGVVLAVAVVLVVSQTPLPRVLRWKHATLAGRIVIGGGLAAAAPGFASAVASIAGRGP